MIQVIHIRFYGFLIGLKKSRLDLFFILFLYSLLCTLGLISFYGFLIGLFDLSSNIGSMRV